MDDIYYYYLCMRYMFGALTMAYFSGSCCCCNVENF